MKKKYLFFCLASFIVLLASCNGNNAKNNATQSDSIEEAVVEEVILPHLLTKRILPALIILKE